MEKIQELKKLLEQLRAQLDYHRGVTGSIVLSADVDVPVMSNTLFRMREILQELEKIENHNIASAPSRVENPEPQSEYKEMVSHPSHYQGNKIECIEAMIDVFGKEKVSDFCELNAFKYQWRANKKGTDLQDKKKAIWYLDKYIELNGKEQQE